MFNIPYMYLPPDLKLWEQRDSWLLDADTCKKIKACGGTLVGKSLDKNREAAAKNWRLSLNSAPVFEKVFSNLNSGGCSAKKVLKLIKDIKKVALEEKDRGLMKSYNVRQTLLWCVHRDEGYFTEDQLLLTVLWKLSLFLKEGFLPSFLEEKRNLIFNLSKEQCKAGHQKMEEVIQRLPYWINCVHDRQQEQQRNLTSLATKLKTIPGAAHFVQPGFLAKVSAANISKKLYTTDKNNEKRHFFDTMSLPKSEYGPQFRNNIEGLEYHLEKAIVAVKALVMEHSNTVSGVGEKNNLAAITDDTEKEVNIALETEKETSNDILSNLSVGPDDVSLSCHLPDKEIISRSRRKVIAESIHVKGTPLRPAPLKPVDESKLNFEADVPLELDVSLNLKVDILAKIFGSKVQLLPLLPAPESFATHIKGIGKVNLAVNLKYQDKNMSHEKPRITIFSSNLEVESVDLGNLDLLELLQRHNANTTAKTYGSIMKDHLNQELGRCVWNTERLAKKIIEVIVGEK